MTVAIKVIDTALRDNFGFNHVLWVYNGLRSVHCWVHCWVCDRKARKLSNEQRASIADYFWVYKVSKHMNHLLKVPFCVHPKTGCPQDQCVSFSGCATIKSLDLSVQELKRIRGEKGLEWMGDCPDKLNYIFNTITISTFL